jgi:hypothetical protein
MVRSHILYTNNQTKGKYILKTRVLSNILEIEMPVISKQESRKGNQKFRQWRMYVHEILCFDVSTGKFAKMNFIETRVEISIKMFK